MSDDRLRGRNATAGVLRLRRDVGAQSYLGAIATSYDFEQGAVGTLSGDADLVSQLTTDWDDLAGA